MGRLFVPCFYFSQRTRSIYKAEYMRAIRKQHLFIAISIIIALIWVFMQTHDSEEAHGCYLRIMGNWMSFQQFNKAEGYYFLAGNFILILLRNNLTILRFILLQLLIMIPLIIKIYICICSR